MISSRVVWDSSFVYWRFFLHFKILKFFALGYSRIPIYDSYRGNVVSILYTKDLAFVDPEDGMPLKSLCEFHQHQCNFVDETEPLDVMFREFRDGM